MCRSVIATDEEGFLYAGDMNQGETVRFGVGDIEDMHQNAIQTANKLKQNPVEAIYAYSCAGRKAFISDALGIEFELMQKIAPVSGFFYLWRVLPYRFYLSGFKPHHNRPDALGNRYYP